MTKMSLDEMHRSIAAAYAELYRQDDDPRWLRELHYHSLLTGEPTNIASFGTKYKTEIFWAGDYLFRGRRYEEALWAFETARDLSLKTAHTEMRRAACLMRSGREEEGVRHYEELIEQYPDVSGIKLSFIDSILFLRDYQRALDTLLAFKFEASNDFWIAGQFGRAYFGMHEYSEAIEAFHIQVKLRRDPIVLRSLARAYRRTGQIEREYMFLKQGRAQFKDDDALKRDYGAFLERHGGIEELREAQEILAGLWEQSPRNGLVLLPYCKVLCRLDKVDVARQLFQQHRGRIFPQSFEQPIEVEILKSEEKWDAALQRLSNVSSADEHLLGVKKEVYYSWAMRVTDEQERKLIALEGLELPIARELEANAPLMITSAKLAMAANDFERFQKFVGKVRAINSESIDLKRLLEDAVEMRGWAGSE